MRCIVENCQEKRYAKGLCVRHYGFHYRRGTYSPKPRKIKAEMSTKEKENLLRNEIAYCESCRKVTVGYRSMLVWRERIEQKKAQLAEILAGGARHATRSS